MRRQIDEEQTFHLPPSMLRPGARIRLQIRRGIGDEVSTVEIKLPKDYAAGKPVRLKGMGKRIGRWQGDLYLTLVAKQPAQ
jgi:molecular chaperone DnaJ